MAEPALKLADTDLNDTKNLAGSLAKGLTFTAAAQAVTDQEVILKAAEDNVPAQRQILAQLADALRGLMTKSAKDSTQAVSGDPVKMAMLNIPTKGEGSPTPTPSGGPQNFSVTQGDHSGDADGHCDRMAGAKMYKAESATSPAGPWTLGYDGTKSKFTIAGLPPGAEMWFRMAAYVAGAWTEWSDPACCRIV